MGVTEQPTGSRVSLAAGAALTRRNGIAFDAGVTAADDPVNAVTRIAVAQEYLNVTDAAVMGTPMVGDGITPNQGLRLQAAVDMAAGRPIFIPAGRYIMGDHAVVQASGTPLAIVGAAKALGTDAATVLDFGALGSGKIAIDFNEGNWNIENIAVLGPGTYAVGTDVANCDGIRFNGRGFCVGVCVSSFRSGGLVHNDHLRFLHSTFDGNAIGLDWAEDATGTEGRGDNAIEYCSFSHNAKAGIAIHSTNSLANAWVSQCHFGNGPYCIWRYGDLGDSQTLFLSGVTFANCSFESHGNGAIVDGVGDGRIGNITFLFFGEANTLTGGARWPGKPVRASFDVPAFYDVEFYGGNLPFSWAPDDTGGLDAGGNPIARAAFRANTYERVRFNVAGPTGDLVNNDVRYLVDAAAPAEIVNAEMVSVPGSSVRWKRLATGATVTQFDLLEQVGAGSVRPYQGGYPAGVACVARTVAGDLVSYVHSGFQGGLIKMRVASGNSVASSALLKPDPSNAGCVKTATNYADGPIVGRADSAVTGPGLCEVEVFAP